MSSEQVLIATASAAIAVTAGYVAKRVSNEIGLAAGFEGPKVGALKERLEIIQVLARREDPYEKYLTPQANIMRFYFAISPMPPIYVVCDKDSIKQVLSNAKVFVRPDRPSQILKGLLDYALFILPTEGPYWKKHRKLLQPGLPLTL